MHVNPYLNFNGDCQAAFQFYEQVLGGKVVDMRTYGDSPMASHVPEEWRGKILYAAMELGNVRLMATDVPPDRYGPPQGMDVAINVSTAAEAERVFQALSEGGVVQMPMASTFWAVRFGMTADRFGIPWMVMCEKE